MPDWAIAVAVVFGTLLGVSIGEFRQWRERRERYQLMTFEKRLEAHQRAFYWCHKLNVVLNRKDPKEIHKIADEAREWWDDNCLFLDQNSRQKMIPLFNFANQYANEIEDPNRFDTHVGHHVWSYLNESLKAITEGIGAEHLLETNDSDTTAQGKAKVGEAKEALEKQKRNTLSKWIKKYSFLPFVIGVIFAFGLLIYISFLRPLDAEFTSVIRGSYVWQNSAAILALLIAFFVARGKWVSLTLIVAIDLFIVGMMFQLFSFL